MERLPEAEAWAETNWVALRYCVW